MSSTAHQALLMRHAHADWPAYRGTDFERPLTPRGLADAAASAEAIRDAGLRPQVLLTSPAARTLQTSEIVARTLSLPASAIRQVDSLYNAAPDVLHAQLMLALSSSGLVMLVAHNPGISDLARQLTGDLHFTAFSPAQWLLVEKFLR